MKKIITKLLGLIYKEYDDKGNCTYLEHSNGDWVKWKYDNNRNITYKGWCNGEWYKSEYDKYGNTTYQEWHDGSITHTIGFLFIPITSIIFKISPSTILIPFYIRKVFYT